MLTGDAHNKETAMQALALAGYGVAPEVRTLTIADPGPGQVRIRIAGGALNPLDVKIQAGRMKAFFPVAFPYVIGTDISGIIDAVGLDVVGWEVGDWVIARLDPVTGGALAETCLSPADQLVRAPTSLALPDAAGFVTTGATAWQALFEEGGLVAGQRVLIHGGAGGVGSFAVQFARQASAHVIATASADDLALVRDLGAHGAIDYSAERFEDRLRDIDLVIDTVGGDVEKRSLSVLRPGGILVATPMPPDMDGAAAKGLVAKFVFHQSDAGRLARVAERHDHGTRCIIDRRIPLSAAADGFSSQAQGRAKGKIIVTP
jgi:NADPH:quinone reductase-like Zn-dependent oxidoreductase